MDPLKSTHGTPKYVEIARAEPEVSIFWKWIDSLLGYNSAFPELQTQTDYYYSQTTQKLFFFAID